MRVDRKLMCLLMLLGLLIIAPQVLAQEEVTDATCPVLVQQALEDVGNNCDSLERNNACYGFNQVDAAFFEEQPEEFFSTPADRAALSILQTLQTAPLNTEESLWGIATLNVQANVPGSLPGQAVVFMLLGDVEIENAVAPEDAFTPVEPVSVFTTTNANIRSGPGTTWNILMGTSFGEELPADGISPDGEWVRIFKNERVGWINRPLVQEETSGSLDALPVINNETRTPMQAFYFRTGFGGLECVESPPSVLVVQGPENIAVNINANGADIQIGSTIALVVEDGIMKLFVLSGSATVDGAVIPAGFALEVELSEDGRSLAGPWSPSRPMTAEELSALTPLQGIPENLLHYAIVLPSLAEIEQVLAAIRNQGGTVIQGTQPGAPQQPPAQPGQPTPVPPAPGGPPPAGQIILEPGEYTSDGGGCGLPGRTTVSGIASDGSGWTWGRVRFNRSSPNTYYAGGILAIVLSPTSFRIGGTGPGACISIWSRTG